MNSQPSDNVTTVVIEMEPGWIFVKIADPEPPVDRIEFFLRRTVDDWFDARPAFVIDRAEAITNHGEMLGLHVWYHATSDRPQPTSPPKPLANSFTIEVHGQIAQQHSKEYISVRVLPMDVRKTVCTATVTSGENPNTSAATTSCYWPRPWTKPTHGSCSKVPPESWRDFHTQGSAWQVMVAPICEPISSSDRTSFRI